jgi:hypothetical protein
LRLQFEMFSDANPAMGPVARLAERIRTNRAPVSNDNPFLALQEHVSEQIVACLDNWRDMIEGLSERTFLALYGARTLQAAVGIDPTTRSPARAAKSALHRELLRKKIAELKTRIPSGGPREAVIRGLLYAGIGRGSVDERGFELARRVREAHGEMSLAEFKALVREQFFMLLVDQDAALAAIPAMLPANTKSRREAFDVITQLLRAGGPPSPGEEQRLREIARLFRIGRKRKSRASSANGGGKRHRQSSADHRHALHG